MASQFRTDVSLYFELTKEIESLDPIVDITSFMINLQKILDKSVISRVYGHSNMQPLDLRADDFKYLYNHFKKNKSNINIELLKNTLSFRIRCLIRLNNTRINYQERFQQAIDLYNSGSMNQEALKNFIRLSKSLEEEDKRKVVEGLTEEEIALFDKLYKIKALD